LVVEFLHGLWRWLLRLAAVLIIRIIAAASEIGKLAGRRLTGGRLVAMVLISEVKVCIGIPPIGLMLRV